MKASKNVNRWLTILIMLMTGFIAQAQGPGPGKAGEMKKRMEELKGKLKLSDTQSAKFDEILKRTREEARKKVDALPSDADPSERRKIMRESMDNADKEIMEILDSDQQAIYKAEKAKWKDDAKENMKQRRKEKKEKESSDSK